MSSFRNRGLRYSSSSPSWSVRHSCFIASTHPPGTDRHPDFGNARYAVFSLILFNHTLEFPEPWYLQILYYLIPVLGLAPVVDGVLRIGGALVSKRDRGQ